MQHAAATLGSLMLIHGGYNNEGKLQLSDFNLFDIEKNIWIKTRVVMNGKTLESEALYDLSIDSDNSEVPKIQSIGVRNGHCLVTVFQQLPDRYT